MTRWAIQLDPDRRQHLTDATLELGELVRHADGSEMLVFRDHFVALKVAFQMGHLDTITLPQRSPR